MKRFNVYKHPIRGYDAVKIGFSWPAFLFFALWAMVKKLWVVTALALLFGVFVTFFSAIVPELAILFLFVVYPVVYIVFGLKGNSWVENKLKTLGYERIKDVYADSKEGAIVQVING